ncbi:multiple sugar transport system permease protein [Actinoplanes campanulatus]|uniref:Multiple sugar transport system permease protein n=1 Tax=Actinoplanes campanulatus TaxID=113559 RepID=A0A7W5FC61_9ACTN|nr:sugar ABC transporter permease [Actinoplanes campanulatus]MBB3092875.1 multiple sugar transport system permease protein [Actinoplanes campanulatus]GGM99606.1 ABC transporter permease [Actinoplanes campanulatus]GID34028.1 ABC transporter permease [Actinoplanes campanulatus]
MTEVQTSPAAAPAAAGPSAKTGTQRSARVKEAATGWLFALPFTVLLVAFLLLPMAYAFKISLYRSTLIEGEVFAWFDNYKQAIDDPLVREGVVRVLIFGLLQTPVMIGIALVAALLIDAATSKFSRFFRLAAFVPYAVPVVIGTLMWGFLYSDSIGPFAWTGIDFTSSDTVLASLGNIVTWQWAGYNMIVLYAALQGLPRDVYESARIDGASEVQIALRIKTPMISSALVLATLFTIMGTLQFFTEPLILQPLNPGAITQHYTPNVYAYNQAFSFQQYNYSAAISFLLGAVVFIGSYIFLFATRKRSALR